MKVICKISSLALAAVMALGLGTIDVAAAGGKNMVMQVSQVTVDPSKEAVYNYYGQKVAKKSVKNLDGTLAIYKAVDEVYPTENYTVEVFQDKGGLTAYHKSGDMKGFQKAMAVGVTTKSSVAGQPFYAKEIDVPLYTMGIADTKVLSIDTYTVKEGQMDAVKAALLEAEKQGLSYEGAKTKAVVDLSGLYATYMGTMAEPANTIQVARIFVNKSAYNAYMGSDVELTLDSLLEPMISNHDNQMWRIRVAYDKGGLAYQAK